MPILGYDQFFALSSGAYAAYSILSGENYANLISDLKRQLSKLQTIYQGMAQLNNFNYDYMVRGLNTKTGDIFLNSSYDIFYAVSLFTGVTGI